MEQELHQLKRMYADMALENRALKDLIEKNFKAAGETRDDYVSDYRAQSVGAAQLLLRWAVSGGLLPDTDVGGSGSASRRSVARGIRGTIGAYTAFTAP